MKVLIVIQIPHIINGKFHLSFKNLWGLRNLTITESVKNKIEMPTAEARKKIPIRKQNNPTFSMLVSKNNLFLYVSTHNN